jgi:hypothetical protein
MQKEEKYVFKFLGLTAASAFEVMHYIRVKNYFTMWGLWVLKNAEFYLDLKNVSLP